jgi:hypothetical protein
MTTKIIRALWLPVAFGVIIGSALMWPVVKVVVVAVGILAMLACLGVAGYVLSDGWK